MGLLFIWCSRLDGFMALYGVWYVICGVVCYMMFIILYGFISLYCV